MRVKNLNGTSSHSCNCGSWLAHWKKFRENNRLRACTEDFCSVIGCSRKATVGGHVSRAIPGFNDWYIVPLCEQCNQRTAEFDIDDNVSLVSANIAETCGRSRRIPDDFRREPLSRVPDDQPLRRLVPARREVTAENQALRRVTTELISRVPDDPKNTSRSRFNK